MPWNVIGQPAATVPVGLEDAGLPLAVQLCGRPNDDITLLRFAHQIERAQPTAKTTPTAIADHDPPLHRPRPGGRRAGDLGW